jgi:hypothetical protein
MVFLYSLIGKTWGKWGIDSYWIYRLTTLRLLYWPRHVLVIQLFGDYSGFRLGIQACPRFGHPNLPGVHHNSWPVWTASNSQLAMENGPFILGLPTMTWFSKIMSKKSRGYEACTIPFYNNLCPGWIPIMPIFQCSSWAQKYGPPISAQLSSKWIVLAMCWLYEIPSGNLT